MKYDRAYLAGHMDLMRLDALAGEDDIVKLCDDARKYGARCVVVNSSFAKLAAKQLSGVHISTSVVVSYPFGAMSTFSKVAEVANSLNDGADEIDVMMNVGMLRAGKYNYVMDELSAIVAAAKDKHVKVTVETDLLNDEQLLLACELVAKSGAAYVCTSTGLLEKGATVSDVSMMKRAVGSAIEIKAVGNIHTRKDVIVMLEAGAERIGTPYYLDIMNEKE